MRSAVAAEIPKVLFKPADLPVVALLGDQGGVGGVLTEGTGHTEPRVWHARLCWVAFCIHGGIGEPAHVLISDLVCAIDVRGVHQKSHLRISAQKLVASLSPSSSSSVFRALGLYSDVGER